MDTIGHYKECYRRAMELFGVKEGCKEAVGGNFVETGNLIAKLVKDLGLKPTDTLVDIGCGPGRLAFALGDYLASGRYVGFDIMEEPLAVARELCDPAYEFRFTDTFDIAMPDDSADMMTFISVWTHLQNHEAFKYLLEAKRVVRPGGKMVVSYAEWGRDACWPLFHENVTYGISPDHIFMQMMNQSQLSVWASRLGLEISFHGDPIGQDVVCFTKVD